MVCVLELSCCLTDLLGKPGKSDYSLAAMRSDFVIAASHANMQERVRRGEETG